MTESESEPPTGRQATPPGEPAPMPPPDIAQAAHRRSWWPGWIWAVPIAALGIVAWLAVRDWASRGPEVTVVFPVVANLKPGDTKVHFQTMEVGQVSSVTLERDLRHLRVQLALHGDLAGKLGPGTQFWIEGESVSLTNLASLKSIIAGPSIGIDPRPGSPQGVYQGLSQAPVLHFGVEGTAFVLHESMLGSISRGTPIYFLDQQVGEVKATRMVDASGFDITAFINRPYDRLVRSGTRFWDAGPVRLSSGGAGPALQFRSIPALFEGAIAFETPSGPQAGDASRAGDRFALYPGRDAAENAPDASSVLYRAVFTDVSGTLGKGAPVMLMGVRVGTVTRATLTYSQADRRLRIEATLALEPSRIALPDGEGWRDRRAQMNDLMAGLVGNGLRAELGASPPVVGSQQVTLRMVPGKHGTLGPGPEPEIPTGSGSDIAGLMATAGDIATKVDDLPLPQIAANIQATTQHVARLAASPDLAATLRHVDHAAADLDRVAGAARQTVPPALAKLRETVAEAQTTLAAAQGMLSQSGNPDAGQRAARCPARCTR